MAADLTGTEQSHANNVQQKVEDEDNREGDASDEESDEQDGVQS